ncbi:MAG: macro domain-containing protein, partial [bacterium]
VTQGFDLPARYIFHAVGPVWHGGNQGEPRLLASCYRSAILKAREMHLQSIAFPAISCGVYGYPHDQAVEVAISAVRAAAEAGDLPALREVIFCCFDEAMAERYRACLSQADNP